MTARDIQGWLKGRTIIRAVPRAFRDGKGGWAHNWCLVLDDGTGVAFLTEETEVGDYGVAIVMSAPQPRARAGRVR